MKLREVTRVYGNLWKLKRGYGSLGDVTGRDERLRAFTEVTEGYERLREFIVKLREVMRCYGRLRDSHGLTNTKALAITHFFRNDC